jgi:catechol 2,3-dioxygenase-like lactoylglutathione lyase family enzyme
MGFSVSGISHVAIRVTDLERSRRFYGDFLGFPVILQAEGVVVFGVGGALLGVRGDAPETPKQEPFDPFRVGLDHVAFAVESEEQLHEIQRELDSAGIRNEGVQDDSTFNAKALVLYDPDGIPLELYALAG